ncbi:MAG TPA: hypothetical protein PLJ31_02675 [Armatimonadota bacterium]|nr:hypothetical protein [Armatimonadota bacterium]
MNARIIVWAVIIALVGITAGTKGAEEGTPADVVHRVGPTGFSVQPVEGVKAGVVKAGEQEVFSVSSANARAVIAVDLGWMSVEPNRAYRARCSFRAPGLDAPASARLMIREHEAKGVRPITPYHVTPVARRPVTPGTPEAMFTRELTFTTGPKTRTLSGALVIAELKGEILLTSFELVDAARQEEAARQQAQAEYEKLMAEIRAKADARVPLLPRPLVFSRSQMKYGLELNYYHAWNDRPLLVNRAYRVPRKYVTPLPGYKRTLQEVAKYDLDGLAFFPETKDRMGMFELHQEAGVPGVGLLPEFVPKPGDNDIATKAEIIERALKSPSTPRIGGKVLITSYAAGSLTPEQWGKTLAALRQRVGDTFLFLPALTHGAELRRYFMAGLPIPRAEIEEVQRQLRAYLDVCDGIYFNYPAAFRNIDRTFDEAFYRDIFIPVFKSVLSEPAYRGKYLGLSAYKSHMSPDRGNSLHEDGTRTLRRSFEAAMAARPDVILLPEWDEFNENTCFRPTVYGGTTTQRIVRYYMSRIKGIDPTPVPGDDTSIPNLILSARKCVTLGEEAFFELLHVPDAPQVKPYTAQLTLLDERGAVVRAFEPVRFDGATLQEHRFHVATEMIPDVRALVPVLVVRGYQGRDFTFDQGFHPMQIRATWNWDYLAVRQPLRDLPHGAKAELAWEQPASGTGPLLLRGVVSSPEELALVEVLADDDEVYAVDPGDEFWRNNPERECFLIEYRSVKSVPLQGSIAVKNASVRWLTRGSILHQPAQEAEIQTDRLKLKDNASEHQRWIYLSVPRQEVNAAEVVFDLDQARFSVPLRQVLVRRMIARAFENGLQFTLFPYRRQIDMPVHLGRKEVSFTARVWPEIPTEQYHLRLTTVSGKVFRSRPLLLPGAGAQPKRPLRVYSQREKRPLEVQVSSDRVPVLDYEFSPERGAVLLTPAGRPFWASLGGFTSTTTGRGALNGLFTGIYPAQATRTAPEWVEGEGGSYLRFDGTGTYLELPREALPRRGAFTLELEVRPATDRDQCLLTTRTVGHQNGLGLSIVGGKLHATFRAEDWSTVSCPTELSVPAGAWSTIRVRHDFEKLTIAVNGRDESFPVTMPAYNIGFTLIGEGWKGSWFAGDLRRLRVAHHAE